MSYILIMIVMNSAGSSIATQSIGFQTSTSCLQAVQKLVEMEPKFKITATCVRSL
jgi:hypothetical protein